MKPRLFWTMLLAFILVIFLGVCGMMGFFGLAVAGFRDATNDEFDYDFQQSERAYAATLADYYIARGNSWRDLDERLNDMFTGPFFSNFAVVDADRQVVASVDSSFSIGDTIESEWSQKHGVPIEVEGEQVGMLVLRTDTHPSDSGPPGNPPPFEFVERILRGFALAGLGLITILSVLAIIFSRWFSRPLRAITDAAQSLSTGRLETRAPRATIREMDDLARTFNTMAQALDEADRQRRQMTADIAHELRTPLSIIKGRLEGLQDGVYEATPDQIDHLLGETALLERLINDLRVLALADAGQLPLYPELIDPRDLLEHTQKTFTEQAQTQQVSLRIEAPEELPDIDGDEQRLAQVMGNLVANALRYTPPEGTITLVAERSTNHLTQNLVVAHQTSPPAPSSVVLRVRDTGAGIDEEMLPYIFDRFWRADRARTRTHGGTGLGLAIVKQIVAAHGGKVWAESTLGQGTTISLALPVTDEVLA
ncbi:MAG: ATP-binding protein [Chloroflexota bacterium]